MGAKLREMEKNDYSYETFIDEIEKFRDEIINEQEILRLILMNLSNLLE